MFASNSDRQCIRYATQVRTCVAVRSVFPKAIETNMNVSKCGLVENDASAKSRKDYLENRVRYLLQVTHSVVFYIQIEA